MTITDIHLANLTIVSADKALSGSGITPHQAVVLQFISEQKTCAHGDIAYHLDVTPAVVTGLVDRLVRRELVERKGSKEDRRVVFVKVTPAGAEMLRDVDGLLKGAN